MEDKTERLNILRLTEDSVSEIDDTIVREFPLTIILNDQELVTMLCSPANQKELAVGFLYSEGLIETREEIKNVTLHEGTGVIRVETTSGNELSREALFNRLITSGCGRGASFYNVADITGKKVESLLQVSVGEILALTRDFQHRSETFRSTGGVHSAALCDTNNVIVFNEDIGRHNALDKVFGECLIKDISTDDRLVITSGRISSEILLKVARRNIPILVSKSAPTNLGVNMANELGVTLVGFVRGKRANVYTNTWRINRDGK